MSKNICIIPARAGSKRIPDKNFKPFHGKPLIVWSIEEAQKSNLFEAYFLFTYFSMSRLTFLKSDYFFVKCKM